MTLTEFLEARISEDESLALGASEGRYSWASVDYNAVNCEAHGYRWSPTSVVAECAAKRKIVQYVEGLAIDQGRDAETEAQYRSAWWIAWQLATVYADHPDYNPEWT